MRSEIKSVATVAFGITLFGATGYFLYLLFKKDSDDDYNETIPVSLKQTKIEMKIPNESVRTVIGRNGSHIREIERKSQTKICFKDREQDEKFRMCVIRGPAKNCSFAESLIHEFLAYQPVIETKDLWVPRVAVGRIIGRCGERIHYITQLSGAKIHVAEPGSLDANEKQIIIKGTNEQIEMARSYIMEIVREDTEIRQKLEEKLAQREPRGKPRNETKSKDTDVMKQSSEKLTNNGGGGDGQMEVYVSAVVDPSQFWLQIVGPKANELDQLVEEMTEYYSKQENQEIHVISEPGAGEIVAAVFMYDGKYYRSEITDLRIENERQVAQLYFLDYGDTDVVPVEEIFELRTDFLRLRFQAIECYLARVKPAQDMWTEEAIDRFEEWTQVAQWKKLRARVSGYKDRDPSRTNGRAKREGSPIPGVDLYDINHPEDLDIALELVRHGYAVLDTTRDAENIGDCRTQTSLSSDPATSLTTSPPPASVMINGTNTTTASDSCSDSETPAAHKNNGSAQLLLQ